MEVDLLREVDLELKNASINENEALEENITYVRVTREWTAFRDALVEEMFEQYQARRRRVI